MTGKKSFRRLKRIGAVLLAGTLFVGDMQGQISYAAGGQREAMTAETEREALPDTAAEAESEMFSETAAETANEMPSETTAETASEMPSETTAETEGEAPSETAAETEGEAPSETAAETEEETVSEVEEAASDTLENELAGGTGHLTDTTLGYQVYGVSAEPRNYNVLFQMKTNQYIYNVYILYTTDAAYENQFFPGVTKITATEAAQKVTCSYMDLFSSYERREDGTVEYTFEGEHPFEADTTYYYRFAYYDSNAKEYYFLTLPDKVTTKAAVENSAVSVSSVETEAGYLAARVVWAVENPGNEAILSNRLYYTQTDTFDPYTYVNGKQCKNEDGSIVEGKYYADIRLDSNPVKVRPSVAVYTTEGQEKKKTEISAPETPAITRGNMEEATVTTKETVGYHSFESSLQITPWYKVDDDYGLYLYLFYRKKGEEIYKSQSARGKEGSICAALSELSAGTEYEYYIQLKNSGDNTAETLKSIGSEEEPFSFTTKEAEVYEDSQFPDAVFRRLIKEKLGISENEKITGDELEKLQSLYYGNAEKLIKSIEGIQYITNLESVYFYDQAISDAQMLTKLPKLKQITLSESRLKTFPDLSGLSELQEADFNYNRLTADEVVAEKLPAAFLEKNPTWITDTLKTQKQQAKVPGKTEINLKYAELSWDMNVSNTYASNPSTQPPYAAGRLSNTSLNNALNLVNFIRYVAGISDNVTLSEGKIEQAQAGALVNSVNGVMSHYPTQPSGFPSDLYQKGKIGCSRSNLAMGYSNLARSIVDGWMYDGDASNIGALGHRRWVISPELESTGFGAVGGYSAMYALCGADYSGTSISDFVAWPARNMPIELVRSSAYPWSISLGVDYQIKDTSKVRVTMKEVNTGKTWSFSEDSSNFSGNYFSVNSAGYGTMGDCIIFRPSVGEISYAAGSSFEITVTGLSDKAGDAASIKYSVNFFSLGSAQDISVKLNKSRLRMLPGDSFQLTAAISPGDVSDKTIKWSSSDETVATVDETGRVTAVSVGDAVITASSAYKGKKAACKVTVRNYALDKTEISFDLAEGVSTQFLTVGDGMGGTESEITWESSDESVVRVSKSGVSGIVKPAGSGTAQICAVLKDGPTLSCNVTVWNNVLREISLNSSEYILKTGDTKQLKVYFFPNDTTLSKEIAWSSDRPECVSVDETGKITALSKGTAVVTAAVGEKQATCSVTVTQTAAPDAENFPTGLFALTNVQTKLADISLEKYEGWEWEDGEILLGQFAGMQEKSFIAVYHQEGYADYRVPLRVSLASLTGISVAAERNVLTKNGETPVKILWKVSGSEEILPEYIKEIHWSSNTGAVEIEKTDMAASYIILKSVAAGKATITAEVVLKNGKTFLARTSVKVTDGETAEFTELSADGLWRVTQEGSTQEVYEGNLETTECTISLKVMNATKLSVKSSNKKVVSTGKVVSEDGGYEIFLSIKAAGTAKITFTANDKAGTKKEILLRIRDARPNLSDTALTVNKLKTQGSTFYIYPNEGYVVTDCGFAGENANQFEMLMQGEDNSLKLKAKDTTAKGKYKLAIKVTVSDTVTARKSVYELPLTVTVTEQKLKVTVKQSAKVNLFYKNLGMPELKVTANEVLTGMELTDCDFKLTEVVTENGRGYVVTSGKEEPLTKSCDKKGTIKLTFEGYETISMPYTVSLETKKPKLSLDKNTVTLYPDSGINNVKFYIKEGGKPFALNGTEAKLQKESGCSLVQSGNDLILTGTGQTDKKTIKEEITLSCDNWNETITLPFTLKTDTGKPALKLQKTTLQLNTDLSAAACDMAETEVMWKNGALLEEDTKISVSAVNEKAQAVINDGIIFEQTGSRILAKVNNKNVAAGTYKFKVNVTDRSGTSASLTVKVVNKELTNSVKISKKGTIDVLNRENSFVTVTPSLKYLNAELVDVGLSGRFSHLFEAGLSEDHKILIYAKVQDEAGNDVALVTKYNYGVNLVLTYQNAEGDRIQLTTPEIKLKLKQGKPKVTIKPLKAAFFSGAEKNVRLEAAAELKSAKAPEILKLELVNFNDVFQYSDGVLSLLDNGVAVKEKTYNLQFRVSIRGQADNEKAITVKYKVKIK